MEQKFEPFEVVKEDGRTILRLHGTEEQRERVEADKVHIIMDAIAQGWDIDIRYADIDGSLDISKIADEFERITDWLLDIPSSRGTRPWKPLVFGLAIILLAAGIFALGESMSWPFGTAAFEATRSPTAKAPRYYSFLFSVENFMPAMKPKLIGSWEVSQKYIWVAQLEAMLGWLWFGLTAWSIRESFF